MMFLIRPDERIKWRGLMRIYAMRFFDSIVGCLTLGTIGTNWEMTALSEETLKAIRESKSTIGRSA